MCAVTTCVGLVVIWEAFVEGDALEAWVGGVYAGVCSSTGETTNVSTGQSCCSREPFGRRCRGWFIVASSHMPLLEAIIARACGNIMNIVVAFSLT